MAGSAGGIRAGLAYVEMGLKDSALVKGLKDAETNLKAFGASVARIGASLSAAGAAITAPFLLAAKSFADAGTNLLNMSLRTGVSVEALSALGYAATQTGTDLDAVEVGIKRMQKTLTAAALGDEQATAALKELGLTTGFLLRMSPQDQFAEIAKAISAVPNPTFRAGAALKIFGKSGTALIPLLSNFRTLTDEAQEFGLIMSTETARGADAFGDAMRLVTAVATKLTRVVGGALAPMLTGVATSMARIGKTAMDWLAANQPLVVTIFQIGVALAAAGAAITILGAGIIFVGAVFGVIASGITLVGTAIGLLLSPIGLAVAAVGSLAVWLVRTSDTGGQALAFLKDQFGGLLESATTTFKGIADALSAGNIKLAAEILWTALKVEWLKGTNLLKSIWADWGVAIVTGFRSVSFGLASIMTDMWAGIQTIFVRSIDFIQNAWEGMIQGLKKIANGFEAYFKSLWEGIVFIAHGGDLNPSAIVTKDANLQKIVDAAAAKNKAIDAEASTAKSGRLSDLNNQVIGIESNRTGAQGALGEQQQSEIDARRKAADEGLSQSAAELAQAQEELAALTAEAGKEAKATAGLTTKEKGAPGSGEPFTPEGLDKAVEKTKASVDVKGSFSASALSGLGAGDSVASAVKDGVKEQKKTNDKLDSLNKKADEGRLVFTSD